MSALEWMEIQYNYRQQFKDDSYCSVDLLDQETPNHYAYEINISTQNYDIRAYNMAEGTLSRIVSGLESRQTESTKVILGDQFSGVLVLNIENAQEVAFELHERNAETIGSCLIRMLLTAEEIRALQIEMSRAANFFGE